MRRLRSHLTYANVVATLALVIAVGGGAAYAANTVFSTDIVDGQVKEADVGQGAVASDEIKNDSILAGDVAPNSLASGRILDATLTGADVKDNALKGADIDESTLSGIGGGGPAGGDLTGSYPNPQIAFDSVGMAEIADGAVQSSELGNFTVVSESTSVPPGGGVGEITAECPFGSQLVTGGASFPFKSGDLSASIWNFFNWYASGQNNGGVAQDLTVRILCLG